MVWWKKKLVETGKSAQQNKRNRLKWTTIPKKGNSNKGEWTSQERMEITCNGRYQT